MAVLLLNASGVFGDAETRGALAHAIDVPALQRRYDHARTALLASLLLEGANDRDFARALTYDPAAARELRERVRSHEVVLTYVRSSHSHERVMTLLQQNLQRIGVNAVLRPVPAMLYMGPAGPLRTGAFDIAIDGFAYDLNPDLAADWACRRQPPRGGNFARWCDRSVEASFAHGRAESTLRALYDSVACIPLSRAYEDIGVAPRVRGVGMLRPGIPFTYGCARWTIV